MQLSISTTDENGNYFKHSLQKIRLTGCLFLAVKQKCCYQCFPVWLTFHFYQQVHVRTTEYPSFHSIHSHPLPASAKTNTDWIQRNLWHWKYTVVHLA